MGLERDPLSGVRKTEDTPDGENRSSTCPAHLIFLDLIILSGEE
jgi:hypothetical protein